MFTYGPMVHDEHRDQLTKEEGTHARLTDGSAQHAATTHEQTAVTLQPLL